MMNRNSMGGNRTRMGSSTTTFGLDERLERTLLYPISAAAALFVPFGWVIGLLVFLFERNHNVRRHALQSGLIFGILSILLALVGWLKVLLGGVLVIGAFFHLALGLLGAVIFWVIIALAVWLTVMVWFRPNYRLPFVGRWIDGITSR